MIFPSKSKPWIILPLRLVRSVAANYASNRSKWRVKTIIADGRNLFLNTLTWFLKFFARLSLLFWGRRKFFLIRKSRASVSNDSELLEFLSFHVWGYRCSIIVLFLFPWKEKKSLEKSWKKSLRSKGIHLSSTFSFPSPGIKFSNENCYRTIVHFFPLQAIGKSQRIFFFSKSPLFQNCEDISSKTKLENYRCLPPPSSKQIYLRNSIRYTLKS